MAAGFFAHILSIDLSQGTVNKERLAPQLYREHLGGYGLGVRLLYDRMAPGADPLGPENILGFFPGLLTGSGVVFSGRFMVTAKSPLTEGWGECNCGGHFGPILRSAGLDGLLVTGASPRPVYLAIDEGQVEIRDASHLWGLDTAETEQRIKETMGRGTQVVSIGPAGERRVLLASIMTDGGRAAARSGLGAVMGSKRLKAIAVRGSKKLPVYDRDELTRLSRDYARIFDREPARLSRLLARLGPTFAPMLGRLRMRASSGPTDAIVYVYREYGTCLGTAFSTEIGDAPIHNWRGVGARDFPMSRSERISDDAVIQHRARRYHCRNCPVGCGGILHAEDDGDGARKVHKPEFETLVAFGPLLLNDDLEAILRINEMCDRYGLDTISTGATVAFALECAEKGLIEPEGPGALALTWGNAEAIVELVRSIALREGIGDLLADGVKRAAARLGEKAQTFALHVGGQELPMHDSRHLPLLGLAYVVDPTPARHNTANGGVLDAPSLRDLYASEKLRRAARYEVQGQGRLLALLNRYIQVVNCAGLCMFSLQMGRPPLLEWLEAATGWEVALCDLLQIGHRIQILRHAFNLREGIRPRDFSLPPRASGHPPLDAGPSKGVTLDMETMVQEFFGAMGYDPATGIPTEEVLESLGLITLAEDFREQGG
jgi:aldehyde:ferredoxin oxidoreductase